MAISHGKILKLKTGYNPNSSSIGTNLTPLLIGGAVLALAVPVVSIIVARHLRRKNKEAMKIEAASAENQEKTTQIDAQNAQANTEDTDQTS